jgi:hypothetical protein
MPESSGCLRVTYVSRNEERLAIVPDPEETPWRVFLCDSMQPVDWQVALMRSGERTRLFDSLETAKRWAAETIKLLRWWLLDPEPPRDEDRETAEARARREVEEANQKFAAWAEEHGYDPTDPKTVRRARHETVIGSVCLYRYSGCTPSPPQVVPKELGDVCSALGWIPDTYCATEPAKLYEDTYGWMKTDDESGMRTLVDKCTDKECRDVPHDVRSVRVQ